MNITMTTDMNTDTDSDTDRNTDTDMDKDTDVIKPSLSHRQANFGIGFGS
jgi:hypothetical protein